MAGSDDKDSFKKLLSTVVSLGHGGEIMLMVGGNAFLKDKPGFDFVIFENLFRIAGTNLLFQEFASVGVSDRPAPDSFKWFECDPYPPRHVLKGCVGAVPTSEGGDQFDLAELGLKEAKYIWIKDLGKNKNFPSKWPTEGADLDAVMLIHAFDSQ